MTVVRASGLVVSRTLAPLLSSLLLASPSARAQEAAGQCAGLTLPATAGVDDSLLHLNGAGVRRVGWLGLGFDVYVTALYLEHP